MKGGDPHGRRFRLAASWPEPVGVAGYVSAVSCNDQYGAAPSPRNAGRCRVAQHHHRNADEDGVPAELVADLVGNGLASMQGDTVKVGGRAIEIIRVQITDAGQRAIEGP